MNNRLTFLLLLAISAATAVTATNGQEVTVVPHVLGAEGPLYVDGNLYYVSSTDSTLNRWDGYKSAVVSRTPGCGDNGVALTKRHTLLVACMDGTGAILEFTMKGKLLERWDKDTLKQPFTGGVNDLVVAANGGAYATTTGAYTANSEPPAAVVGRILYLPPEGKQWVTAARDLNYANGIGISPDQRTLYVDETVGNCILKFNIRPDGSLTDRWNFALLSHLVKDKVNSPWIGPDSMKVAPSGDLYVAQWGGGKVLKISPQGRLLHVFNISAGDGTTNVAFGPGRKVLYVTVAVRLDDPRLLGRIVMIQNVE